MPMSLQGVLGFLQLRVDNWAIEKTHAIPAKYAEITGCGVPIDAADGDPDAGNSAGLARGRFLEAQALHRVDTRGGLENCAAFALGEGGRGCVSPARRGSGLQCSDGH